MRLPAKVFLVSHTHWDREWYLPYHRFRIRLVEVVKEVLDRLENEEAFRHFLLDGQAAILDDYLEVCPEDRARIARHVKGGALSIGPWYVLSDTFLVSGEATVRNLLMGDAVAAEFGGGSKVGYVPDAFGHIAQLPQILARSGIDSFIYTRGNGDEITRLGLDWDWQAPDGSEVLAVHQSGGYCNAAALGHDELWHAFTRRAIDPDRAVAQVRERFERLSSETDGDVWLLMNGCDHHPPQRELPAILGALREAFPDVEFVHADLASFLTDLRAAERPRKGYTGELVGGKLHPILSGVRSSRMYLKQANDICQTLLFGLVEPILAYGHFVLGHGYPAGPIGYAQKQLLLNHPHDSICGCSIDPVHREMETRFAAVMQTGEQLLIDETTRIAPSFGPKEEDDRETAFAVVNPLPVRRTEVVERLVVLPPTGIEWDEFALFDEQGDLVPFDISEVHYVERFWGVDYREALTFTRQRERFDTYLDRFPERMHRSVHQKDRSDCYFNLRFIADLPALGHANFFLRPRTQPIEGSASPGGVVVAGDTIENEFLTAVLHPDGTFDLTDKGTGQEFPGLSLLTDTEDVGDEYDYSPAPDSETVTSRGANGEIRAVLAGGLLGSIETQFAIWLPESIAPDRQRRGPRRVPCPVLVRLTLRRDSRYVEVSIAFENRAEDHRLRAQFPTGIASSVLVSDGPFVVTERPVEGPEGKDWVQPPPDTFPQQEFSLVEAPGRGLAILGKGLPEVAATTDAGGRMALHLTLLRAVGWLSRDDLETRRRQNAGPTIPTPGAQCRGIHRFLYAVVPFGGDWLAAGIKGISERWRHPVIVKQGVEAGLAPGGRGLFSKESDRTSVTAIKRHRERDTLVVRFVNLTGEPVEETLTFGPEVAAAWQTDLLEARGEELAVEEGRRVSLLADRHEIVTLEVEFTHE